MAKQVALERGSLGLKMESRYAVIPSGYIINDRELDSFLNQQLFDGEDYDFTVMDQSSVASSVNKHTLRSGIALQNINKPRLRKLQTLEPYSSSNGHSLEKNNISISGVEDRDDCPSIGSKSPRTRTRGNTFFEEEESELDAKPQPKIKTFNRGSSIQIHLNKVNSVAEDMLEHASHGSTGGDRTPTNKLNMKKKSKINNLIPENVTEENATVEQRDSAHTQKNHQFESSCDQPKSSTTQDPRKSNNSHQVPISREDLIQIFDSRQVQNKLHAKTIDDDSSDTKIEGRSLNIDLNQPKTTDIYKTFGEGERPLQVDIPHRMAFIGLDNNQEPIFHEILTPTDKRPKLSPYLTGTDNRIKYPDKLGQEQKASSNFELEKEQKVGFSSQANLSLRMDKGTTNKANSPQSKFSSTLKSKLQEFKELISNKSKHRKVSPNRQSMVHSSNTTNNFYRASVQQSAPADEFQRANRLSSKTEKLTISPPRVYNTVSHDRQHYSSVDKLLNMYTIKNPELPNLQLNKLQPDSAKTGQLESSSSKVRFEKLKFKEMPQGLQGSSLNPTRRAGVNPPAKAHKYSESVHHSMCSYEDSPARVSVIERMIKSKKSQNFQTKDKVIDEGNPNSTTSFIPQYFPELLPNSSLRATNQKKKKEVSAPLPVPVAKVIVRESNEHQSTHQNPEESHAQMHKTTTSFKDLTPAENNLYRGSIINSNFALSHKKYLKHNAGTKTGLLEKEFLEKVDSLTHSLLSSGTKHPRLQEKRLSLTNKKNQPHQEVDKIRFPSNLSTVMEPIHELAQPQATSKKSQYLTPSQKPTSTIKTNNLSNQLKKQERVIASPPTQQMPLIKEPTTSSSKALLNSLNKTLLKRQPKITKQ